MRTASSITTSGRNERKKGMNELMVTYSRCFPASFVLFILLQIVVSLSTKIIITSILLLVMVYALRDKDSFIELI
jgi:hypothetical protein